MQALKSLGQNFLTDRAIAARIVSSAGINPGEHVWEIGPGQGILTRELLAAGCSLTAFELDRRLEEPLRKEFGSSLELIRGDILRQNWPQLLAQYNAPIKLVANIPYQITSPLLGLLELHHQHFSRIVLMVQKEVAERICASPGSKQYSAMTLRLKRLFDTQILFEVGRSSFTPVPGVDSAVISLSPRAVPPIIKDTNKYLLLVKLGFANRRKTLRNNLSSLADRDSLEALQLKTGIDLNRRGETLSEEEFILLSDNL
ncbi:MAG: ribosomal RNA small subunit methyltransferase A [Candidatus Cloacimonetes bacterium]|nr:ribosomal RNA small subunit methyltransferase A [Candidatus Cloacimonadota bacterium]